MTDPQIKQILKNAKKKDIVAYKCAWNLYCKLFFIKSLNGHMNLLGTKVPFRFSDSGK